VKIPPTLIGMATGKERFIRAASESRVDESGKSFEEAMRKLAKRKPQRSWICSISSGK
jgi:hypothetical protein